MIHWYECSLNLLKPIDESYVIIELESNFFKKEIDSIRNEIWMYIHLNSTVHFYIVTKELSRINQCIPVDWDQGYSNVTILYFIDQKRLNKELVLFLRLPIQHRMILHEAINQIEIQTYLHTDFIEKVICIGDLHSNKICDYNSILYTRKQCEKEHVNFEFYSTGTLFRKDNHIYKISKDKQVEQALKANLNLNYDHWLDIDLYQRISKSKFRSSFHLKKIDKDYIDQKGMETIEKHAHDFIHTRIVPKEIINDGKQTPMKGHPVFIAQHATGCCCRGCLKKWHGIEKGIELDKEQEDYIVNVLMNWILKEYNN